MRESGGQMADTGAFLRQLESQLLAEVKRRVLSVAGMVAHKVVAKETLLVGDRVAVVADAERARAINPQPFGDAPVNARCEIFLVRT